MTDSLSPEEQLDGFISKYDSEIGVRAYAILGVMRQLCPGSQILVYDNYNALAIGLSPTERTSDGIFSIALYPRWVSLFFLQAAQLPDPDHLLKGNGKVARHIVVSTVTELNRPEVQLLIENAIATAKVVFDPNKPPRIIIKSISANQRPRRPHPL